MCALLAQSGLMPPSSKQYPLMPGLVLAMLSQRYEDVSTSWAFGSLQLGGIDCAGTPEQHPYQAVAWSVLNEAALGSVETHSNSLAS